MHLITMYILNGHPVLFHRYFMDLFDFVDMDSFVCSFVAIHAFGGWRL